jgi:hypothetical protein
MLGNAAYKKRLTSIEQSLMASQTARLAREKMTQQQIWARHDFIEGGV